MRKAGLVVLGVAILTAGFFLMAAQRSMADTLLVNRGLPTANLNNAAGDNRSNVAWGYGSDESGGQYLAGDDFTINGSGTYVVDKIVVWGVGTNTYSLWVGPENGSFTQYQPSVTSIATYSDGSTYQGSSGKDLSMYELDFAPNTTFNAGTTYQFFLDGSAPAFLHSSNAGLSGSTQQGSDGYMLYADRNGGTLSDIGSWTSYGNGWDKASDANILVYGTGVPEPGSLLLLGFGLFGLALLRIKFRTV